MTTTTESPTAAGRPTLYFLGGQVLLLGFLFGLGIFRARSLLDDQRLPPLREEPLAIQPLYDYDTVVSDEQLERVLLRLRPRLNGDRTNLNFVDHSLRFWTQAARFREPQFDSGNDLRRVLLDHHRFAELYGPDRPSLLIDKDHGVAVRTQEGDVSSWHPDHVLACLAEVGTPLSYPVITPSRTTTYRAMLEQSLQEFSLNQPEYEWSALAYALFLPPTLHWRTREGQTLGFDRLAERIMREAWPSGVCLGTHRLFTLTIFLRVDDQVRILSPATREAILRFLQDATQRLVEHQHVDGFWNDQWATATPVSREPTDREGDRLNERLIVTGHVVEWWATSPQQLHPPRPALVAAAQWMVRTVDEFSDDQIQQNQVFLTHVGRGLALWRSRSPVDVIRNAEEVRGKDEGVRTKDEGGVSKEVASPDRDAGTKQE